MTIPKILLPLRRSPPLILEVALAIPEAVRSRRGRFLGGAVAEAAVDVIAAGPVGGWLDAVVDWGASALVGAATGSDPPEVEFLCATDDSVTGSGIGSSSSMSTTSSEA